MRCKHSILIPPPLAGEGREGEARVASSGDPSGRKQPRPASPAGGGGSIMGAALSAPLALDRTREGGLHLFIRGEFAIIGLADPFPNMLRLPSAQLEIGGD